MRFNVPNALTWFRIIAIPLVAIVFFWLPEPWNRPTSGLLFALAGITDYLDGYLARRLGQTSSFGAFLDPVADKLIVAAALVLLVQADPSVSLALVAAIIIGREITVSALREWMSQIVGISLMLYRDPVYRIDIYETGEVLLFLAAALTIWSMIDYLRAAWPAMRGSD